MKLFDNTIYSLENSLNYSSMKNKTISNNIANVDTPNFKTQNVVFKDILQNEFNTLQLKQTSSRHFPASENSIIHSVHRNQHTMYNHNGNNVDIDKEMANLAENQIYYRSLVDRMNGKFQTLQTVIRGGN